MYVYAKLFKTCIFAASPGGQRSDVLMQLNLVITPESLCRIATIQNAVAYGNRPVFENDPKFCAGGQLNEDSCNVSASLFAFCNNKKNKCSHQQKFLTI